jgi:hypothetical protein
MCTSSFVFTSLLYLMLETLHIYTSILNWFSPGGGLSRAMLTKITCVQISCMLSFISALGACKDPRGVLFVLRYLHVLTSVTKTLARAP